MKNFSVISEIASSHCGQVQLIKKISNIHCRTNSDYLKFQIFKTKNLFSQKNKKFERFKKIEINFKDWEFLINKYLKKSKLILEPFDEESYEFCKKFKKKVCLKISSSESENINLILDAIKNFNKIFINVSGMSIEKIKKICSTILKKESYKKKIIFMYGFQSYPTKVSDLRFDLFKFFKKRGLNYGYSDHSEFGINKKLIDICTYAIKKEKCKYLEKHVCANLNDKPNDYITSINIKDMNFFIKKIHSNEKKIGFKFKKVLSKKEQQYNLSFNKFAFTKKKIVKGETLSIKNIEYLRSSSKELGLSRLDFFLKEIRVKKTLPNNTQIFKKDIIK